jgi:nitrite reductase/ring-hydroxylating ferredoxin subunit
MTADMKSPLQPIVDAVESAKLLDKPGKAIAKSVRGRFKPGPAKDAVSGTWLGHAIHPMLTDVVIGSFLSATLLDVIGGDEDGTAAQRLIAVGIAAYGPTALTGANDWADTEPVSAEIRRAGLVHAGSNAVALSLYTSSLVARRRGDHGRGKLLGAAGAAVLGFGGFLGGHLSFTKGVGPNQTIYDEGPGDWTEAAASSELANGEPKAVNVGDTPVFMLRHGDHIHAIHDRCSHRGCSLAETGEVEGEVVECGCHGSRFSLRDGSLQRGPATVGQPAYDVREQDGKVEIKLQSAD